MGSNTHQLPNGLDTEYCVQNPLRHLADPACVISEGEKRTV